MFKPFAFLSLFLCFFSTVLICSAIASGAPGVFWLQLILWVVVGMHGLASLGSGFIMHINTTYMKSEKAEDRAKSLNRDQLLSLYGPLHHSYIILTYVFCILVLMYVSFWSAALAFALLAINRYMIGASILKTVQMLDNDQSDSENCSH